MGRSSEVLRHLISVPSLIVIGYLGLGAAALKIGLATHLRPQVSSFRDVAAAEPRSPQRSTVATLTFVFNPRDCVQALRLARFWTEMGETGVVAIEGVVVDPPDDWAVLRSVLKTEGIQFPLVDHPDRRLEAAIAGLGYDSTPITLLTDRHRRPRLILPGVTDELAQLGQVQLVRAHLELLKTEAQLNDERDQG